MAKGYICQKCGERYVPRPMAYYDRASGKLICKSCHKKLKLAAKNQVLQKRVEQTGMKQNFYAMFLKVIIGISSAFVGVEAILLNVFHHSSSLTPEGASSVSNAEAALFLLIGIALMAWGLVPYIKGKIYLRKHGKR